MGACHVVLKPVKMAASRRGKKRKELDPQTVCIILITCSTVIVVICHLFNRMCLLDIKNRNYLLIYCIFSKVRVHSMNDETCLTV